MVKGQSSFVPGPAETQVRAESNLLSAKVSFVTFYAKIFVLEEHFHKDTDSDNITYKKILYGTVYTVCK